MNDNTEMDTLIEVVGNCIRNEIKTAEKHKGVYPEASDMKSVEHNLSVLPPSSCLKANQQTYVAHLLDKQSRVLHVHEDLDLSFANGLVHHT